MSLPVSVKMCQFQAEDYIENKDGQNWKDVRLTGLSRSLIGHLDLQPLMVEEQSLDKQSSLSWRPNKRDDMKTLILLHQLQS